jgi:hypothetical protein
VERLLGEHRWSDFLRNPSEEEKGRVSQIFYCTYSTGRQAQKDGMFASYYDRSRLIGSLCRLETHQCRRFLVQELVT